MSTQPREADSPMDAARSAVALRARQRRARRFGLGFSLVWLGWLSWPIVDVVTSGKPRWAIASAILLTVVFMALYAAGMALCFEDREGMPLRMIAGAMVLLPFGLAALIGVDSASYFMFTAALMVIAWPVWVSLPAVVVFITWALALPLFVGQHGVPRWLFPVLIAAQGALMYAVRRMEAQKRQIDRAHDQLAEVAVADERARFGRDLHDILGHSLTSIIVKAELAGKLAERDSTKARAEIADIERLAREGLDDVRRTAAGYRDVTLAAELVAARSALEAAGIHADLPQAVDDVPGSLRELFGWAVREGITNVVRHSGAGSCEVRLTSRSVRVIDDGVGGDGTSGGGLRGLDDRAVTAGAVVETRARSTGFELCVRVEDATDRDRKAGAISAGSPREGQCRLGPESRPEPAR